MSTLLEGPSDTMSQLFDLYFTFSIASQPASGALFSGNAFYGDGILNK